MSGETPGLTELSATPAGAESRTGVLAAVSDWLKLLALVVLVGEVLVITAMTLRLEGPLHQWYPVFGLAFLLSVVAGFFFDRYLESRQADSKPRDALEVLIPEEHRRVKDEELAARFGQLEGLVAEAADRNIRVLTAEMRQKLNDLSLEARAWSQGQLHSTVQRYIKVTLDLYAEAKHSIFSTTVRDYLTQWPEELMERMISASEGSPADSITRVFVFGNRSEIDVRAIAVLKRFRESRRITSLVYIDDEDPTFHFPPDISRDFVVIDGGHSIGVTLSYGEGNMRAQWYFEDEDRKRRFKQTCEELEAGSRSLDDILEWWESKTQRKREP